MRRRDQKNEGPVFRAPPGYRDSGRAIFSPNEVVASTYQIGELLHGDDTGQVFEAWDMLLERTVALKAAWRDSDAPSLRNEARAPTAIHDPCVAAIYGLGNHHASEYLVAERIAGVPLTQHVAHVYEADHIVPAREAIEILVTLARGLAAVHEAGHAILRMSAANILRVPGGRLVFARFALGQGQLDNKPPILAPEVISRTVTPELGTRSAVAVDLYALGCVAMELCTGAPPFVGDSARALQFAHVHQRPPPLGTLRDDLATELGDLIGELLAKSPDARPGSAREVTRQLATIAERTAAARRAVKVLLVDDDAQRVRSLWGRLRRAHASVNVDAVASLTDAAARLADDPPDVLVLSMNLPGTMNGLEMCMYLRGFQGPKTALFVAMAEEVAENDATVLEQVGVDRVLSCSNAALGELGKLIRDLAAGPAVLVSRA